MNREQVLRTLRAHQDDLRDVGVAQLYLFGSVARDDARADRDVDLFFETDNPRFSLIELIDVQYRVAGILESRTDIMTRASLHPLLRVLIETEAIRVF